MSRFGKFKPARAGDNGIRCETPVHRQHRQVACGRHARRYDIAKNGWHAGMMDLCSGHATFLRSRGYVVVMIDRRKKAA